jgi:hypothetical protein
MANGDQSPPTRPEGLDPTDRNWQLYLQTLKQSGLADNAIPMTGPAETAEQFRTDSPPKATKVGTGPATVTYAKGETVANPQNPNKGAVVDPQTHALTTGSSDDWQDIPNPQPASLADHPEIQKSIDNFRGQYLYDNAKGFPVYQKGGVKYVLAPGKDQYSDTRVYDGGAVQDATLPTSDYMPQINQMVELAGGRDPWTNQPFTGDLTDPQQKVALAAKIKAWNDAPPVDPGLQKDLNNSDDAVAVTQKVQDDMSKLNDADIGKLPQVGRGFLEWTAQDFKDIPGLSTDKAIALRDLQDHLKQLNGILGSKDKDETGHVQLEGAKEGTTGWGAVANWLISGVNKAITTGGNLSQYRNSLPQVVNQNKKDFASSVANLANQRYRVSDQMRAKARQYQADLQKQGFGPNDSVLNIAQLAEGPKTPEPQSQAQAARGPIPPAVQQAEDARAQYDIPWGLPGYPSPHYQHGGLVQPMPAPIAAKQYLYGGLPGPMPAPLGPKKSAATANQPMPAPIAKPVKRAAVPSYGSQAELDAAGHPPGTVFHWIPTDTKFVKI